MYIAFNNSIEYNLVRLICLTKKGVMEEFLMKFEKPL